MGEVWKAWDTQLGRWVALKFLKGGDDEEIGRFLREAQTAGRLNHPHIAAVHEVGAEHGRHFIAMQFVDGRTLKRMAGADRRVLARVVRDAARAIAYANEQGIVHRDLKPENIMVVERAGQAPHAFVMDFGLARSVPASAGSGGAAADGSAGPPALRANPGGEVSVSGSVVGTPSYMAPEQARGEKVDARADVYGLGATLYEVLTRRAPFKGANVYEILKKVQEEDPAPPRALDPAIDADLETIALKGLEKEPARRYGSAGELADDLDRWLNGEPVAARPAALLYRLRKRVAKRLALAAALAGLVAVAIGAAGVLLVQSSRAARRLAEEEASKREAVERERAERRRREEGLRRLSTLWSVILERKRELRELTSPPAKAREELRAAVRAVDACVEEWPSEPQGYYVRARGRAYLGELDLAVADLRAALARRGDFRPGWSLVGLVKMEEWHRALMGEEGEGEERLRTALPLLTEALDAFARGWEAGKEREESERWGLPWTREDDVARRLSQALRVAYYDKREDRARDLLEQALAEYRSEDYLYWSYQWLPGPDRLRRLDEAVDRAPGYALARFTRGVERERAGNVDGALEDYGRAIELQDTLLAARVNRATLLRDRGDFAGAIADCDRALAARPDFAEALLARANARLAQGDRAGALADYDRVVGLRPDLALGWYNRGVAKVQARELQGAISDFDRAIGLRPGFAPAWVNRGIAKRLAGDPAGASADYTRAIELQADYADAFYNRGIARRQAGDLRGALADYDKAVELRRDYLSAYLNRGGVKLDLGDLEGAVADATRAIELKPDAPEGWHNRGAAKLKLGDAAGAVPDFDRAIRLRSDYVEAYRSRAAAKRARGDATGALDDLDRAIELAPAYAEAYAHRAALRSTSGNVPGAVDDYTRAIDRGMKAPEVYANRGRLRETLGDAKAAIADYETALRLAPRDWKARGTVEGWLNGARKD
jgi:tetratricopeptide (TPR) repeat protein